MVGAVEPDEDAAVAVLPVAAVPADEELPPYPPEVPAVLAVAVEPAAAAAVVAVLPVAAVPADEELPPYPPEVPAVLAVAAVPDEDVAVAACVEVRLEEVILN